MGTGGGDAAECTRSGDGTDCPRSSVGGEGWSCSCGEWESAGEELGTEKGCDEGL